MFRAFLTVTSAGPAAGRRHLTPPLEMPEIQPKKEYET